MNDRRGAISTSCLDTLTRVLARDIWHMHLWYGSSVGTTNGVSRVVLSDDVVLLHYWSIVWLPTGRKCF